MITLPDYQKLYTTVSPAVDGFPYIGLKRINTGEKANALEKQTSPFEFLSLESQTNYLRISSIEGHLPVPWIPFIAQ